jgi:hypothetical protein
MGRFRERFAGQRGSLPVCLIRDQLLQQGTGVGHFVPLCVVRTGLRSLFPGIVSGSQSQGSTPRSFRYPNAAVKGAFARSRSASWMPRVGNARLTDSMATIRVRGSSTCINGARAP